MNAVGYTFEYGLDNEPYNLRKMAKGGSLKAHALEIGDEILSFQFGKVYAINKGIVYTIDLANGIRKETNMNRDEFNKWYKKGGVTDNFDSDFISLCKG